MTEQDQIIPPTELVHEWANASPTMYSEVHWTYEQHIANHAARWGADEELNACCDWVDRNELWPGASTALRSDRRLGPFGAELKDQALEALNSFEGFTGCLKEVDVIRRALEALPDQP